MNNQNQNQNQNQFNVPPKKKSHWLAIILIVFFLWIAASWLSPGMILMVRDMLSNQDEKDQKQLEEIVKSIQPAPARQAIPFCRVIRLPTIE